MENRNSLLDNFKGILIFLVVFGHFIENFQDIWLHDSVRVVWQFIYVFHMPGFAFVSGFFSKKDDTRIFEKVLSKQILPLVVFQCMFEILSLVFSHHFTGATFSLTPYWILWYLLSLAFWRIFFQLLHRVTFIFIISVILALGVGSINSIGYPLSMSRTIVLFPVFLLGNIFREKEIIEKLKKNRFLPVLIVMSVALLVGTFIYVWKMRLPNGFYLNSYDYASCGFGWKKGGLLRLINLTLASLCIMAIMLLTPQKQFFASETGRNSMIPYLVHGFLLKILLIHRFQFYTNLYFTFIGGLVFSFLVVYVFGRDSISKSYDNVMLGICRAVIKEK